MQRHAIRFTRFTGSIVAALTSRKAARFCRNVGQTIVFLSQVFVLLCQVAIALGYSARDAWEAFCCWADQFVESCTYHPVKVQLALAPAAAPIALLPPARERRRNTTPAWAEEPRLLIIPAPVAVQPIQPAKRKRGRPKKAA